MTIPIFEIYLRNASLERTERLDVYSSLKIISRFNRVGTWDLEIPADHPIANFVDSNTGIIVYRDGDVIFSGSPTIEYRETKNSRILSGTCDNVFLESPTRPTPSQAIAPYDDVYDVTTGVASTIMISLVNRNIGPLAPTSPVNWQINNLEMGTDPVLGATITSRTRFDPLITMLAQLASTPIATGLGFRIRQSSFFNGQVEFEIYEPQDKSVSTIFSVELRTAQDFEHVHKEPNANYFIVAGGDNFGIDRTLVEGGDATSIAEVGRVIAVFVDRRGTTDLSELEQNLAELIATAITTDTITIIPSDVSTLTFGVDYDLGDIVTVVVNGTSYIRLITEIELDFNPRTGVTIKPTIADPFGTNDDVMAQHVSTLGHRISNIERNWTVPEDSIIEDMLHPTMKWYPGDVKITARSAAQTGWLLCDGSQISRSTYSILFSVIGTIFGAGNGTTTFHLPNTIDKYVIGKGPNHALGASAGDDEIIIANHQHTGAAHTHPQSHTHGVPNHNHPLQLHDHDSGSYQINSAEITDVESDTTPVQQGSGSFTTVTDDTHTHDIGGADIEGISSVGEIQSTATQFILTENKIGLATDADSNVGAASYTASSGLAGAATLSLDPPNVAMNYEIYTGVIPV